MEIGIDSFASASEQDLGNKGLQNAKSLAELIDRIAFADEMGLDVFGLGEHHRKEFLDSAAHMILAAAASRTSRIKLTSAVTVLSAIDPVRAFQNYATLDLISSGRAEMVVGRGSFTEAFPLFGYNLHEYDSIFTEKLDLILKIRENEQITWSGKYRPSLQMQTIYPRPLQEKLPIWLGVGGTPASFARAGSLGLPLMVAIIGGETHRFRPLIDLYRSSGLKAGYQEKDLKVGIHSLGYVGADSEQAKNEYYPGYAKMFTKIGQERGWGPVTRSGFDSQNGSLGALVVGDPTEVAEKIIRHSEALGGIDRFTFQMDAGLSHDQLLSAIELIGSKVSPLVKLAFPHK